METEMTFGETARRVLFGLAVVACAASWVTLGLAWGLDWPQPIFIGAVFAAAFSTEAVIWIGAVVLGWTAFANRARLWRRLTGVTA
jgi:hypothetical protein